MEIAIILELRKTKNAKRKNAMIIVKYGRRSCIDCRRMDPRPQETPHYTDLSASEEVDK